MQVNVVVVGI